MKVESWALCIVVLASVVTLSECAFSVDVIAPGLLVI